MNPKQPEIDQAIRQSLSEAIAWVKLQQKINASPSDLALAIIIQSEILLCHQFGLKNPNLIQLYGEAKHDV